ncbi:MAG: hypothetical protein IKI74_06325 [Christensenellaceae bacterium]|nr:hypothetical protein [Christensenellaceae bacterium]
MKTKNRIICIVLVVCCLLVSCRSTENDNLIPIENEKNITIESDKDISADNEKNTNIESDKIIPTKKDIRYVQADYFLYHNFAQLYIKCKTIITGRVIEIEPAIGYVSEGWSELCTPYIVEVTDTLKGNLRKGDRITIHKRGGEKNNIIIKYEYWPDLEIGKEYFLAVYEPEGKKDGDLYRYSMPTPYGGFAEILNGYIVPNEQEQLLSEDMTIEYVRDHLLMGKFIIERLLDRYDINVEDEKAIINQYVDGYYTETEILNEIAESIGIYNYNKDGTMWDEETWLEYIKAQ